MTAATTPQDETACPTMPDSLSTVEQAAWREFIALLEPSGVLSPVDAPLIELMARTVVAMRKADAAIATHGPTFSTSTGYQSPRPEVGIAHKSRILLKQLLAECGATPASRSNVDLPPSAAVGSKFREFAARRSR